jgi:hypothetical protein
LLVALNELVEQEGMYLRGGSFGLVAGIRQRTDPIVRQLVELSSLPGVSDLRGQVAAVVERSARHSVMLQEKMEGVGAEIRRTDQARHRAAQLVPAYVRPPSAVVPRFLAAG